MKKEEYAEEEGSEEEEGFIEEEVPAPRKKSRAGTSHSSTRSLAGPMFEI